jgi:hypothetical protein
MTSRLRSLALLVAAVAFVAAGAGEALAFVPAMGTTPAATTTVVNQSNGPQRDPHVSGSLISYTDQAPFPSRIHVFDLGTSIDTTVPGTTTEHDFLSDVSGTNLVFTRIFAARSAIMLYNTTDGTLSELDAASDRTGAAIGGETVAWMDMAFPGTSGVSEIVAHDLAGGGSTRLTNDAFWDFEPAVSPGGDVVVWTKCTDSSGVSGCDVYKAVRSGSAWTVTGIPLPGEEAHADTDGSIVVYDSERAGEFDIYWQPVSGGSEEQVTLAESQRNPNVSNGLISFDHQEPAVAGTLANWDIALYEVATNTLYKVTNTPEDDFLNDVDFDPVSRQVRVVFTRTNNGTGDDVYASTFTLPSSPSYTFTGFFSPVNNLPTVNSVTAGRAIPIKFSLGGDQGLDIFDAGYPKSQQIACDSTATVDGIEETVTAGGSSLSYDAATDQYTYVWKSDKAWVGTCRQLVLKLDDGTFHRANFKFK